MKPTGLFVFLGSRNRPTISPLAIGAFVLLALLTAATPPAHAVLTSIWSDEFNSATVSNVDSSKWTFESGNNSGWGNAEKEFYTGRTNNAYLSGGLLHIQAKIELTNTFRFTSARMKTQGKFWTTYGRIEWRAKLPSGIGMWPALWMMGTNITNTSWPGCGEIDVVESNGSNVLFQQGSIHSGSDATAIYNFIGGDAVTNFHVYALDWTTNSIAWLVDGVTYETQTSWGTSVAGKSYPFPFNQPFFLLMNLATGGNYVNNPTTNKIGASLTVPQEMQIDYVRVYSDAPPVVPAEVPTGLTGKAGGAVSLTWAPSPDATSYYVKRSLTSGGPYITNANVSAGVYTTNETVGAGNYTDTTIANCSTYYYVVSAANQLGESANSSEVAVHIGPISPCVNSGGSAIGTFFADASFLGGTTASFLGTPITTNGLVNPAPPTVYSSERRGDFSYLFSGLNTAVNYTVRLHFAEFFATNANQRTFNVSINGNQILTNFDILTAAGGQGKAVIREFTATPAANGSFTIAYSSVINSAKSSAVEILLQPPAAPTSLTATADVAQITLNWNGVTGASGYNVKRATTGGGPYTTLASAQAATTYSDTNVVAGTNYYYVVSALVSGCAEGSNSAEVSATPAVAVQTDPFALWQIQYFGSTTNPAAAANADADGTGQNNQFKYIAGLDPTNPSSIFLLTVTCPSNPPSEYDLTYGPVLLGSNAPTYTIQFATDLVATNWAPLTGYTGPVTNGNQLTVIDPAPVDTNKFYRIDISVP